MNPSPRPAGTRDYSLSDDLARLCLPQEFKDSNRKLAWANSICSLFLLVGIVGLKAPRIMVRPVNEPVEVIPVIFTPPEDQTPAEPQPRSDEPPPPSDAMVDSPVVATVVAADASSVAFAVPVKGPVILAPARFAAPPPALQTAPPKPTRFDPNGATGGSYPEPSYPREELLAHHEGTVVIYVVVEPDGSPGSVTVKDGSGHPGLDRHAVQYIKTRWHWPPGETRYYYVPIEFRIQE